MSEGWLCGRWFTRQFLATCKIIGNSLNIPILQASGALTAGVVFFSLYSDFTKKESLHICLTTFGLVLLISEAIMVIANKHFCGPLTSNQNAMIHGFLVSVGTVLTIIGVVIVIKDTADKSLPHYKTIHGITGLTSTILLVITLVLGTCITICKRLLQRCGIHMTTLAVSWLELPHHVLGSLAYALGMSSFCCGVGSYDFGENGIKIRVLFVISSIVIGGWTLVCSFVGLVAILNRLVNIYQVGRSQVNDDKEVEGEASGIQDIQV